jgi:hypothetical protein
MRKIGSAKGYRALTTRLSKITREFGEGISPMPLKFQQVKGQLNRDLQL